MMPLNTTFRRRGSAGTVKKRLKEVIAGDRLCVSSSVMEQIQGSVREILLREMNSQEDMLFAISSRREGGSTVLTLNVSFSPKSVEAPLAS